MKDNKVVKFAILVLALVMIATILVAGTYAKYTSEATASDKVKVAKWSIKLGNQDITGSPTIQNIDLFGTILDTSTDAAETNVKSGKLIAPGVYGQFTLSVENASEVDATVNMQLQLSQTTIPLEFSTDKSTWSSTLPTVAQSTLTPGTKTDDVTVYWRWAYSTGEQGDTNDTALGIAAQNNPEEVTVSVKVTATQVD